MSETIFKICSADEWQRAVQSGRYTGSADDVRDGFIHFSRAHQLAATAAKYFAGRSDLVLVAIDPAPLGAALRYEPSRGGELFPHLYAPLPVGCALWVAPLAWDGREHAWPAELTEIDHAKRNHQTYDQVAAQYFAIHRDRSMISEWMRGFAETVPRGGVVLDLGAGPCEDSATLRALGLDVVSVDRSRTMLSVARAEFPGPRVQADLRQLPFRAGSVAGVWACASLLHLDREDVEPALHGIAQLMVSGGALFVSLKDGDGGKWDATSYGAESPRWYTYWRGDAVDALLEAAGFEIVRSAERQGTKDNWHFRIARRARDSS